MMTDAYAPIARLLGLVRRRWLTLLAVQATARALLAWTVLLALMLLVARAAPRSPMLLATAGAIALLLVLVIAIRVWLRLRARPSDLHLARFVEERIGTLDERLVSAVDVATVRPEAERPSFALAMVRDAASTAETIAPAQVIADDTVRRAWWQLAGAAALFAIAVFFGRDVLRQSVDAAALTAFPSRQIVSVSPGNTRLQAGSSLVVEAELVGNAAPAEAQLLRESTAGEWQTMPMERTADGRFTASLSGLTTSFRYRVAIGTASSDTFDAAVVRPPRVTRIDVSYTYPKAFGLAPRTEENGGDVYAPAGTEVRFTVHTDAPAATGRLALGDTKEVALAPDGDGRTLNGGLTVTADNSYRVALADREGFASRGDTEYFIRTMEDRSPEVHVLRPASDRRVTPLEEVDIEAEATDDFGVAALELVYTVAGRETIVPLRIPGQQTTAAGAHTLFLEDLDLRPGDLVSYFVRARDIPRGKRASEARSDIFFLEVKNFEEEFVLAASQAAGGGASNPQLDELVSAQKEIVTATWKLERRAQAARGARSAQDVKAIADAESELKTRVERTASSFRTGMMRDPRARPAPGRGGQPGGASGGRGVQISSEEEAMTAASQAMGQAVTLLNAQKTGEAVTPEMEALSHLLRAQADVKKREVQRQQAGRGGGSNRATQDLSSLFDKELARNQETNYEAPASASSNKDTQESAIDKIKELARRQDELLKRQQALDRERAQMTPETLKRELERLTRAQSELRQQAEEVAEQLSKQQGGQRSESQSQANASNSQSGQQSPPSGSPPSGRGQPNQSGQSGPRSSGQQAQSQAGGAGQQQSSAQQSEGERRARQAAEEMRASANGMRSQDSAEAQARSARALSQLRELERQLEGSSPDGRRRALGDLQLESRQLAEAQRQLAGEAERARGAGDADALRRLAGEQERLAERLRGVQQGLRQQGGDSGKGAATDGEARRLQQAAAEAGRDIDRQRLTERMEQAAGGLRSQATGQSNSAGAGNPGASQIPSSAPASRAQQEEVARAISQLADRLATATKDGDAESRRLTDQMNRAQELRGRLDDLTRRLSELEQSGRGGRGQTPAPDGTPGRGSAADAGRGEPGRGQSPGDAGNGEVEALREEMNRDLTELRALLDEVNRDERGARGGGGRTFEGRGMTLSDPGTQAFKQDFATWEELKRQATIALDGLQTSVAARLREKSAKDRLTAATGDRAPDRYQRQVDNYFKSLAAGSGESGTPGSPSSTP